MSETGNLQLQGENILYLTEVLTLGEEPSPPPLDPIADRDAKYATPTEAGAVRFRRLVNLGYV